MRFRIGELLLFTGFAGAGFACMSRPYYYSTSLFVSAVLLALLVGLLLAIAVRGPRKYFWIGFAVAGILFAYLAELWLDPAGTARRESLFTAYAIDGIFERTHGYGPDNSGGGNGGGNGGIFSIPDQGFGGGGLSARSLPQSQPNPNITEMYESFLYSANGFIAICAAWFGGHLCLIARNNSGDKLVDNG